MKFHEIFEDVSPWLKQLLVRVNTLLQKKYGQPIGEGRNRSVYRSKTAVIKVPKNDHGLIDNTSEYRTFTKYGKENLELARVRLVHIFDVPVLFMELINTDIPINELPDWAGGYDSFQVGKTRKGQWKAYDYA